MRLCERVCVFEATMSTARSAGFCFLREAFWVTLKARHRSVSVLTISPTRRFMRSHSCAERYRESHNRRRNSQSNNNSSRDNSHFVWMHTTKGLHASVFLGALLDWNIGALCSTQTLTLRKLQWQTHGRCCTPAIYRYDVLHV